MHHGKYETITVVAGANLESQQYKIVTVAGVIAANAAAAVGVLMSKPNTGEHGTVAYQGHMKAYAGGAISAGANITVTASGYMAAVASGSGVPVGRCLTAAASAYVGTYSCNPISVFG
jgi:hypothetical protein